MIQVSQGPNVEEIFTYQSKFPDVNNSSLGGLKETPVMKLCIWHTEKNSENQEPQNVVL